MTKIASTPDDVDAARAAGVPAAPTLLAPSNALVAAAADHLRLERRDRRGVVHDPDRRLERVHRAARARAERHRVDLRDERPGDRRPTSGACAASTRPASPGAWSAVRSFTPQAAPPPAALSSAGRQPVDRRRRERVQRHRRPERRRARRRRVDLAVEQQPGGGQRAGDDHGAAERLHRDVHDHDVARSPRARRSRSRPRYNGTTRTATLTVTPQRRRRRREPAEPRGEPVERGRRLGAHVGVRDAVGRRARGRRGRVACRAATRPWPACRPA